MNALEEIIACYDLGNQLFSFFQDWRIRKEAINILFSENRVYRVLDLGSGPGTLEPILSAKSKYVVCVDASYLMIMRAKRVNRSLKNVNYVQAVFEYLPFREGVIDVGIASYSLRDSFNLVKALREAARVLKRKLVIADIGKPDGRLKSEIIGLYLKFAVPLITSTVTRKIRENPWKLLYQTYVYLPPISIYKKLVKRIFGKVDAITFLMGAAVIIIGEKHFNASLIKDL